MSLEQQWRDFYAALEKLPDGLHKQTVYKYVLHASEVYANLRAPTLYWWAREHFKGDPESIHLWWMFTQTGECFDVFFFADGRAWWKFQDANAQIFGPENDYVDPSGVPYGYLEHFRLED